MLTTKRLARWKAASAASVASCCRKPRTMKYNPCIVFPAKIPPFQLMFTIVLIHWLKPPDQMEKRPYRSSNFSQKTNTGGHFLWHFQNMSTSCPCSSGDHSSNNNKVLRCRSSARGFYQRGTVKMTWTQRVEVFEAWGTAGGSLNSVFFLMYISTVSQ